jgi:basic membrane protein A
MLSKHKNIAFLGGSDVPLLRAYESGYVAGAKQVDPSVRVRVAYAGSFTDQDAARTLASSLYRSGTDIIFVAAGSAGLGAIDAAKSRPGAYIIGADTNQDGLAPGKVLTSVVKRVDDAVSRACQETVAQKPASGHVQLGLASGGIALTPFEYTRATIGAARIAALERLREAIIAGSITPPETRAGAVAYKPVAL